MHEIKVFITTIIALVLFNVGASAQESDILGAWKAQITVLRSSNGTVEWSRAEITLMFEKQKGQLLQGKKHWRDLEHKTGNVAGKEVPEAEELFIGEIESDGRTVRIVETHDKGMMFCRMLGQDKLEVSYIEPHPYATVWTAIFHRAAP